MTHHQNDTLPITALRENHLLFVQELAELETGREHKVVVPIIHRMIDSSRRSARPTSLPFCYIVLTGDERHDISKIYEKICIRYSQHSRAGVFQPEFRAITLKERSKTSTKTLLIRSSIQDWDSTTRRSHRVDNRKC